MLYIPFTFMVDGRPVSNVFQAIIAAEGISPFAAKTFVGMGGSRSEPPHLTGAHPLNPFADRVLLYSKLPRLPTGEEFADVWHMTAFVEVGEEDVRIIGSKSPALLLHDGMEVVQSEGAILFNNPQKVTFIFADETNHDYRMGLRATPCGKHDDEFRYSLLSEAVNAGAEVCELTDDDLGQIASMKLACENATLDALVRESEFEERCQGAELGYAVSQFCAGANAITSVERKRTLWNMLKMALEGLLPAKDAEKHRKSIAKAIEKNYKKSYSRPIGDGRFVFSRLTKAIPEKSQKLLTEYCRLLCSHPFLEWNWADNEMRSSFVQIVWDQCAIPVLRGGVYGEKQVEDMRREMDLVKRRFDEPYTFLLEDKMLKSPFIVAFWRVMNSEGRPDRIKEVLSLYSGDEKANLTLALYGAMCGYAGFSTKRLIMLPETNGGLMEADWIQYEVLEKNPKATKARSKNKRTEVKIHQVKNEKQTLKKSPKGQGGGRQGEFSFEN